MICARCHGPLAVDAKRGWCRACEHGYDVWSRQHASDVAVAALAGTVVMATAGMGLPLLGAPWLSATAGVLAGFGTLVGMHRASTRRRRRQYLRGGGVPRAYLPERADGSP
jgi:hypothetical protein